MQFDKPPSNAFEKWLEQRAKEKMGEHGSKMALFIATLFSNLPYMMLCCIPLFAFVLKVLYVRKRVFYIDHLVYALHIHSFAYLAIMLIVLITIGLNRSIPGAFAGWIIAALWITFADPNFPVHPPRLSTGLVLHGLQIFSRRLCLPNCPQSCACHHVLHHNCVAVMISRSASASALSILPTSVPDPCAFSGRPPPLPPTIGAIS